MANEEQDEATSLYMCDELVMAQTRILHRVVRFLSDGSDNNSNIVSFDFWVTIAGKIWSMRRTLDPIHCRLHARLVGIWIELSRGLNPIASNLI